MQDSDGTDQYANIYQSGGTTNIYTRNGTDYGDFYVRRYNGTDLDISFRVQNNGDIIFYGDDGSTQGVKFDASTNRLAIGTTSPDKLLHLTTSASAGIRLERNDTTISSGNTIGNIEFEHQETSNAGLCANFAVVADSADGDGAFVFQNGKGNSLTERMRIDSSGNVGIGTTAPAYELDVDSTIHIGNDGGSGFTHSRLILDANGATRAAGIFSHNQVNDTEWFFGNPYDTPDKFAINRKSTTTHSDSTADDSNSLVTVDSSGNVGIGTSSPSRKLEISSGHLRLSDDHNVEWGGGTNYVRGSNANNRLVFATNNTEAMRINSSGNVGIGTSNPPMTLPSQMVAQSGLIRLAQDTRLSLTSEHYNRSAPHGFGLIVMLITIGLMLQLWHSADDANLIRLENF